MSLRSRLSKILGSLSSLRLTPRWTGGAAALGLLAVAALGCGGGASVTCDSNNQNCQICDGYGCRPANPDQPGFGGSGGTGGAGTGGAATGGAGTGGAGGAAPCDPTTTTCPCDAETPCATGLTCVAGLCISGCNFSYECGPGKVCFDGACKDGCNDQKPCDAGYACDKGACIPDAQNPQCDAQNPCPSGEICVGGLCTTGCNTSADCLVGEVCDGSTHACIPDPSPKPLCDANNPCPAPQVCEADGYCHYPCADLAACKAFDHRFVTCDAGTCKLPEEITPECSLTMPCPPGKNCVSNQCQ
jgi:hypothetical protein